MSGRKHGGKRRPPARTPDATPARGGAVAAGRAAGHRHVPGWLWISLLVAIVAALVVVMLVRPGSSSVATPAVPAVRPTAVGTAGATARSTAAARSTASTRTSASARSTAPAARVATSAPVTAPGRQVTVSGSTAALIGGGGMAVHSASGSAAAPAGAVGVTLFGLDSATVDPAGRQVLATAAALIRASKPAVVIVSGYASRVGEPTNNLTLSRRRAVAVAAVVRSDLGAAAPRIEVDGRGEVGQVPAGASSDAGALDRRVVVTTRAAR